MRREGGGDDYSPGGNRKKEKKEGAARMERERRSVRAKREKTWVSGGAEGAHFALNSPRDWQPVEGLQSAGYVHGQIF